MKWRDVLVGAIVSLFVTVLGGLGVYYTTKEPDDAKSEKLVYSLSQPAIFTGGSQDLAFSTLTISNRGGAPAKNVSIVVSLKSAEIRDYAVDSNSAIKELDRSHAKSGLRLKYEAILPKDIITVNLLLSTLEKPAIEVRSDTKIGEEVLVSSNDSDKVKIGRAQFLLKSLPSAAAALLLGIVLLYIANRILLLSSKSRNNTGFLLLHSGLTDEADAVLSAAVREGSADLYTLSNYALCKGVKGNLDDARKLIHAANFREQSGHAKAVVRFNEGLIHLFSGDKANALVSLQEAVHLSPKNIKRYCQRSILADPLRSDPAFADLFR
ncbi:MAG: tetratricopeptide repeat protein [Massilia sp.]